MTFRRARSFSRAFTYLTVGAFLNGVGGCSFVTGLTETIPIRTSVPGARIHVDGEPVGTSPADGSPLFVTLKKSKQHYVTAAKEGYEPDTKSLQTKLSGIGIVDTIGAAFWLLPIIPVLTGHAWTLEPESLYLQLNPLPTSGSPRRPSGGLTTSGSCVAVHPDGIILTAYHVVEGSKTIKVILTDGRTLNGTVIRSSARNDLSTIKVNANTPNYLSFAPPGSTHTGQKVFTFGFPAPDLLGKEPKFGEGAISALSGPGDESILLQISVPVQPGNSGGPLVNDSGELLGVVIAAAHVGKFYRETGTLPQNVNWAVKTEYARPLFDLPAPLKPAKSREEAIEKTRRAVCLIEASGN